MAEVGWELIARVVQHHDAYREVVARKVTPQMFPDDHQQSVFAFLTKHYAKYHKLPSLTLLTKKFPRGQFSLTVEEPTPFYLDALLRQYLRAHGKELLSSVAEQLGDDPLAALGELRENVSVLLGKTAPTTDIAHSENWRDRLAQYKRRQSGELLGIPSPWDTWNKMTYGWQPQEFIVIAARPGVGKTWFMLLNAIHVAKLNKRALFFSKEMSIPTLQLRADAIWHHLPYQHGLRSGTLTDTQWARYRRGVKRLRRRVRDGEVAELTFVADANMSVSTIEAKIDEYRPDVVFVDGLYLVEGTSQQREDHERMRGVSRQTKALGQAYNVPLLATSQIHRVTGNLEHHWRNLTLGDLAFTDAFAQDGDSVFALIRTEDHRAQHQMFVKTLKVREGDPDDWLLDWNLTTMRKTFYEVEERDDEGEEEAVAHEEQGEDEIADAALD